MKSRCEEHDMFAELQGVCGSSTGFARELEETIAPERQKPGVSDGYALRNLGCTCRVSCGGVWRRA